MKWIANCDGVMARRSYPGKIIGEPQPEGLYTSEHLQLMGLVGVYEEEAIVKNGVVTEEEMVTDPRYTTNQRGSVGRVMYSRPDPRNQRR